MDDRLCIGCGYYRPIHQFPLGRPRATGIRVPMRFCVDCITRRSAVGVPAAEKRAIRLATKRTSRRRRARQTGVWA